MDQGRRDPSQDLVEGAPRIRLTSFFHSFIVRHWAGIGRPGDRVRTLLCILTVGLGVGVVLAIQLANRSAIQSFESSLVEIAGRANLSILGAGGVDELLLPQFRETLGPEVEISPAVEAVAVVPSTRETLRILGTDILQDSQVRETRLEQAELSTREFLLLLTDPHSIIVGETFALRHGLQTGSQLPLLVGDRREEFTVRAVLAPQGVGKVLTGNIAVMDIAAAQLAFRRLGKLDRIDLVVPQGRVSETRALLEQDLPPGLRVERPAERAEQTEKMLRAFRWNLTALSYVSLIVGAFLIYNTIAVSVVRRRGEIGTLRALGATSGQVLRLFLAEALLLGLAGGIAGIGLGRLLADFALQLVSGTVNTLYAAAPPAPVVLDWNLIWMAVGIGGLTAVLSALLPALEASGVLPAEALQRGAHERQRQIAVRRYTILGVLALGLAGASSVLPAVAGLPLFGYLAAFLVIVGFSFLMPLLLFAFISVLEVPVRKLVGVEGRLAARGLAASPARISVLVMSLATAVAMMASVAIMVGSFRQTVELWAEQTLRADLFLKPAAQVAGASDAAIPPEAIALAQQHPQVEAVDAFRALDIVYDERRMLLGAGEWSTLVRYGNLLFTDGRPPGEVMSDDVSESVIVSEPFAIHSGIGRGDHIELDTPAGPVSFEVKGVYYDYSNDRGTVVMDRDVYRRLFQDDTASTLAIYLTPGADGEGVKRQLDQTFGDRGYQFLITPNAALQQAVLRVFDRTFTITYALEVVALLIAALGIANSLLAFVIERRRELGILRVLGASRGQLRKMILTEAGLVGLLGNLAGWAMGLLLSLILIYTVNRQSFGWTIQFSYPAQFLALSGLAIWLVSVVAGLYPARVAARFQPAEVIAIE